MEEAKVEEIMVKSLKMAERCQKGAGCFATENGILQGAIAVKIFDALYREEMDV